MLKSVYIGIGTLSLSIGIIGIVVPLLPTTPFLLLSAACYAKGSTRLYHWFINVKWIGKHIENYHEGKGVTIRMKLFTILFLWCSISISMMLTWPNLIIQITLIIIATAVTYHIISLKTMRTEE